GGDSQINQAFESEGKIILGAAGKAQQRDLAKVLHEHMIEALGEEIQLHAHVDSFLLALLHEGFQSGEFVTPYGKQNLVHNVAMKELRKLLYRHDRIRTAQRPRNDRLFRADA